MRRVRRPKIRQALIVPSLLASFFLAGSPAAAYIVFLKDGSQIQVREKPRIDGDRAILVLLSGTEAFYTASDIDFEKTEEINVIDYGSAKVLELEGDTATQLAKDSRHEPQQQSFGDYLLGRGRGLALPEVRKRDEDEGVDLSALPLTPAGFLDLMELTREPYARPEIAQEIRTFLAGQGVSKPEIFKGSEEDRVFVEVLTPTESSVFEALADAADSLLRIRKSFPDQVAAFELLLVTEEKTRSGQFLLTPEIAGDLAGGKISLPVFFLRYVEF